MIVCPECGEDAERRWKTLSEENAALKRTLLAQAAAMIAVTQTAGGLIEGRPTGPHNILQRIRQLVELEKRAAGIEALPP
jgi:hypothetical protein